MSTRLGFASAGLLVVLAACKKSPAPDPDPAPATMDPPAATLEREDPAFEPALIAALPELVTDEGSVAADASLVTVHATADGIYVLGAKVAPVVGGEVPPEHKAGGARGLTIDALSAALARVDLAAPINIAVPADARYELLLQLLYSASTAPAGATRFRVLARAGDRPVAIAIDLPERRDRAAAAPATTPPSAGAGAERTRGDEPHADATGDLITLNPRPTTEPTQIILAVAGSIVVASVSGRFGTFREPYATIDAGDDPTPELARRLDELVAALGAAPRSLLFMAASDTPARTWAPVLATAKARFPDLLPSNGLE